MSVKKKSIGTGITKRPVTHVDPTDKEALGEFLRCVTKDPIADARDFCEGLADDFRAKQRDTVQRILAATSASEKSKAMHELAALKPDIDTERWFAIEVLNHLDWADSNRDQGQHRSASSHEFQAGAILGVAAMKFTWEKFAISGQKAAKGASDGNKATYGTKAEKDARKDFFQETINIVRDKYPSLSSAELWRRTSKLLEDAGAKYCSAETLRKHCTDPQPPNPRKSKN
jgi:hypothetical protein